MDNLQITLNDGQQFTYEWKDVLECERQQHLAIFQFTENNYNCDCNLQLFLDRHNDCEDDWDGDCGDPDDPYPCGDTLKVAKIELIENGYVTKQIL